MKMSYTKLKTVLLESLFNPQTPGPIQAILEVHNPTYYLQRAREEIKKAETATPKLRQEQVKLAISLLAVARLTDLINQEQPKVKNATQKRQKSESNQPEHSQTPSGGA
jgi:hypothetical protein